MRLMKLHLYVDSENLATYSYGGIFSTYAYLWQKRVGILLNKWDEQANVGNINIPYVMFGHAHDSLQVGKRKKKQRIGGNLKTVKL